MLVGGRRGGRLVGKKEERGGGGRRGLGEVCRIGKGLFKAPALH